MSNQDKIESLKEHPLENFFNLEPKTTEITKLERSTELTQFDTYDEKDTEVEDSFQEVYDKAMTAYDRIQDDILDDIEPRYAARVIEVATTTLSVALEAASKKAKLKEHKDKLLLAQNKKSQQSPQTLNQTVIMSNTADLIKTLKGETVDVDYEELTKDTNGTESSF